MGSLAWAAGCAGGGDVWAVPCGDPVAMAAARSPSVSRFVRMMSFVVCWFRWPLLLPLFDRTATVGRGCGLVDDRGGVVIQESLGEAEPVLPSPLNNARGLSQPATSDLLV